MFLKLIHIINIWTILLSTVGITTYAHYCQDTLKSVSFFANIIKPCCPKKKVLHKQCCSNKNIPTTSFSYRSCYSKTNKDSKIPSFKKRDCCLDKKNYVQSNLEASFDQIELTFTIIFVLLSPIYLFNGVNDSSIVWDIRKNAYMCLGFFPPPNIPLYIAHQSFLC